MLQGVTKRMKISRRVVANDGTARKEEKVTGIPFIFIDSGRTEKNDHSAVNENCGKCLQTETSL